MRHTIEKKRSTLFLVWLIPIIALVISTDLLYKSYKNKGIDIVIIFDDASGFEEKKTPLKYKGISIGQVKSISVDSKSMDKFSVTATIKKEYATYIAREGTKFWKIEPKITLTEISGLSTIVTGEYIEISPASTNIDELNSIKQQYTFIALKKGVETYDNGKFLFLESESGNLPKKAPLLYKGIVVGSIIDKQLINNSVIYKVFIEENYNNLIKEDSNFWIVSSIDLKVSLAGVKFSSAPLLNMIYGGIEFDSPQKSKNAIKEYFRLYTNKDLINLNDQTITLYSDNAHNLNADFSKVLYQGVEAGKVIDVEFIPEQKKSKISIKLKNSFNTLLNESLYFWVVTPKFGLNEVTGLDAITQGSYITFTQHKISNSDKEAHTLFSSPPPIEGKKIILYAETSSNIHKNSTINYKDLIVGTVNSVVLEKNKIKIDATIKDEYSHLINDSSYFYIKNPIEMEFSLRESFIKTSTVESILLNSISFITPDLNSANRKSFILHDSFKKVKDLLYKSNGVVVILKSKELNSIKIGTSVIYKGEKVGEIVDYSYNQTNDSYEFSAYIKDPYNKNIDDSSDFFVNSGVDLKVGFDGINIKSKTVEDLLLGSIEFTKGGNGKKTLNFNLTTKDQMKIKEYFEISLSMQEDNGLKQNSSILYKNVEIGYVKSINFTNNNFITKLFIHKDYKNLINKDTIFWVETFSANLIDGIKNPSAITGSFLSIKPGIKNEQKTNFELYTKKIPKTFFEDGLRITLYSTMRRSIDVDTPLYYRQFEIGNVEDVYLSQDGSKIIIELFIADKYKKFIRQNSKFYLSSVIATDFSLFDLKVKTGTLETMLKGGISLATPNDYKEEAQNGDTYTLNKDPKQEWLDWNPKLK